MGLLSQCILESELSVVGLNSKLSHTISESESLLSACTARYISDSELSAVGRYYTYMCLLSQSILESELSVIGLNSRFSPTISESELSAVC